MTTRKSSKSSFGRDSLQSRSSISASASKLPRSTPLMLSSRKVLPSHTKSASKRSSYFAGSDHHMMKDTRPLAEKGYMRKCITELISFLTEMGYPHPLTPKMMSPPTNKEYFRIFEFIYSLISPNYKMVVRPEEETAKILSDLGYPFNVSKSTLNNIGAMSAWPNALGALDWLADLVKYFRCVVDDELTEMLYNTDKKQELFHGYLQDTYTAFMHGENAPFTEIDSALSKQIAEMNKDTLAENEQRKVKVAQQEAEKKALLDDKSQFAKMEQDIVNLQDSKGKLEKYLVELDKYCISAQEQCDAREAKLRELDEMVTQMEQANREIQSTVTGQELSVVDVQNMGIEVDQIEKSITAIETKCKELQEQCFEKQIEQSNMIDKINMQIVEYMETCKALELIPIDASNAEGIDYSLSTDRAQLDKNVEKLLTVIRPKNIAMKSALLKESGRLQQERNHNATTIEQLKDEGSDHRRSKSNLEMQFEKLKEEEIQKKAEFERISDMDMKELEKVKEEIQSMKTIKSLSIDEVMAQAKMERELLKETASRTANGSESLRSSLVKFCDACLDYKDKFVKVLQGVNSNLRATSETCLPQIQQLHEQLKRDQARVKKFEKMLEEIKMD